ncbi:MAG: sugar phosphate isomerase/epimerase family protein [bacterium]
MLKIGVITDGISQDFEYALDVMAESGLKYVEIQSLWNKQVGDLAPDGVSRVRDLTTARNMKVSCISPLLFSRVPLPTKPDEKAHSDSYTQHIETLKRCISLAKELGTNLVRIFSFKSELVLFGAEEIVLKDVWKTLLKKLEEPVRIAEKENVVLAIETAIFDNIATAALAKKLIDGMGSENLRVLWDPCSALYSREVPYPSGYELVRDYIVHIHIKDGIVDRPMATFNFCRVDEGQMKAYYPQIVRALKKDRYQGVISLESVYVPEKGIREDGFRESLSAFKKIMA